MAVHTWEKPFAFTAEVDLLAKQFFFVKLGTNVGEVNLAGAGELAVGVIINGAPITEEADIMITPGEKMEVVAGGVIAYGNDIASDAAGKAVVAVAGDYILGKALEAAAAEDDYITLLFQPNGVVPTP